jgi:hypothetical protein
MSANPMVMINPEWVLVEFKRKFDARLLAGDTITLTCMGCKKALLQCNHKGGILEALEQVFLGLNPRTGKGSIFCSSCTSKEIPLRAARGAHATVILCESVNKLPWRTNNKNRRHGQ